MAQGLRATPSARGLDATRGGVSPQVASALLRGQVFNYQQILIYFLRACTLWASLVAQTSYGSSNATTKDPTC